MLRTVTLRGPFRSYHPHPIEIQAETLFELIEAVTRQVPGFKPSLKGRKRVTIPGYDTMVDLFRKLRDDEIEFDLVPYFGGSGGGNGILQIIVVKTLIIQGRFHQLLLCFFQVHLFFVLLLNEA